MVREGFAWAFTRYSVDYVAHVGLATPLVCHRSRVPVDRRR